MTIDLARFEQDLKRLIDQSYWQASDVEALAVRAAQQKILMRACQGLLHDVDAERARLVERVGYELAPRQVQYQEPQPLQTNGYAYDPNWLPR